MSKILNAKTVRFLIVAALLLGLCLTVMCGRTETADTAYAAEVVTLADPTVTYSKNTVTIAKISKDVNGAKLATGTTLLYKIYYDTDPEGSFSNYVRPGGNVTMMYVWTTAGTYYLKLRVADTKGKYALEYPLKNVYSVTFLYGDTNGTVSGEEHASTELVGTAFAFEGQELSALPTAPVLNNHRLNGYRYDNGDLFSEVGYYAYESETVYGNWEAARSVTATVTGYNGENFAAKTTDEKYFSGDTIDYDGVADLFDDYAGFGFAEWKVGDETASATMPTVSYADRLNATPYAVTAEYAPIIGNGDVNGDKEITEGDITLYRKWLVGGYDMTVYTDTASAWDNRESEETAFFKNVADINFVNSVEKEDLSLGDGDFDIRDVAVIRMAIVTGYGYIIQDEAIVLANPNPVINSENIFNYYVKKHADSMTFGIDFTTGAISWTYDKDFCLDLGGKTLTVESFVLTGTETGNVLTVKNGTIVSAGKIEISAPGGSVYLEDVVLQSATDDIKSEAASTSLHLSGDVFFMKNATDTAVLNTTVGTHIVVESGAQVTASKIALSGDVANQFVIKVIQDNAFNGSDYIEIVKKNDEQKVINIEVQGFSDDIRVVKTEGTSELKTPEAQPLELSGGNAVAYSLTAGLETTLTENVTLPNTVLIKNDVTLNLSGHSLTYDGVAFIVSDDATLTVNGAPRNSSVKGSITVGQDGSNGYLVINGGLYVITSGSANVITTDASCDGSTVTITDARVIASEGNGILLAADGQNTISDSIVTGKTAIYVKAGEITLDNVTLNKGTPARNYKYDPTKSTPNGDALIVDNCYLFDKKIVTSLDGAAATYFYAPKTEAQLRDAITQNNGQIVINGDIELATYLDIYSDLTFTMNGHTISSAGTGMFIQDDATVTIEGDEESYFNATICVGYGASNGNLVLNGGHYVVDGDRQVIHTTGNCDNCTIVLNGVIVTSEDDIAIQMSAGGVCTITGSTVTGTTALYVKAGVFEITGETYFIGTGASQAYQYNANGSNATGDAVVIDNCYYPYGNAKFDYDADTTVFTSENGSLLSIYWYVVNEEQFVEAAGNAPCDGSVIVLGADITLTEEVVLTDCIIEYNGHSVVQP